MRIGITGQSGFIGWHFYQNLKLIKNIDTIDFDRSFFENKTKLNQFLEDCDVVLHLAAQNRNDDLQELYSINVDLVKKLVESCNEVSNPPIIYIGSSTQEDGVSIYGKSKLESWRILEKWGAEKKSNVGSFVIPNVFGPFGKPNYNSFIATFCHNVANGIEVQVTDDKTIDLIHVHDLVNYFIQSISAKKYGRIIVPPSYQVSVVEVYSKLMHFKEEYFDNGHIPSLISKFDLQLFNMFRTYIPNNFFPKKYKSHSDGRGAFVEIVRANTPGQFSFSTTNTGITRGNHFHTRKAERFAVISGKATIKLRKIGSSEIIQYNLDGNEPSFVDMPIWYTHNITNVGDQELVTLFWINEPYDPDNSDTYFIDVEVK